VDAGELFAVYVEARDSGIAVTVKDPAGQPAGQSYHSGPRASGAQSTWSLISATSEGDYTVEVRSAGPSGYGGDFTLRPTEVSSSPETAAALIHLNDTVSTEVFEQPADVDDFEFDAQEGDEIVLFLQTLSTSVTSLYGSVSPVQPPSGQSTVQPLAAVEEAQSDKDFESRASGRFVIPASGRYRFRAQMNPTYLAVTAPVPYRFQVYRVNRAPESLPVTLTIGDTLSEAIDHVGDIDEFTLSGAPGSSFNVFAEASGSPPHVVVVTVPWTTDPYPMSVSVRAPTGRLLLDNPTGTFTIPASGSVTVRVADERVDGGVFRGPYRLLVYPIDPNPEGQSAVLVPSVVPVSGAIDQYGDVDVYSFTLVKPTILALRASVYISTIANVSMAIEGPSSTYGDQTGNTFPAGSYRLRIRAHGPGTSGTFRGPYQFALVPVDTATEVVNATLAVGDTVRLEASAWPWDFDRYHLAVGSADTVIIEASHPNAAGWTDNVVVNDGETGARVFGMYALKPDSVYATPRIDLSATRSATLSVEGGTGVWAPGTSAPYQLVVKRVSAAPEHGSASIAAGDTVREPFDFVGDIDDFVLRGTPRQLINLTGGWPIKYAPPNLVFTLIDPATGARLGSQSSFDYGYSQTVPIPSGGEVRVRVCVATSCITPACQAGSCTMPDHPLETYWFVVNSINTAPEVVPATYVVGDTVSGEKLDIHGDVDDFHFDATAGQHVSAQLQWLVNLGPATLTTGLQLLIIDATTNDVLGTLNADYGAAQLEDMAMAPIVLPRTGQYIVRIQSHYDPAYGFQNIGAYRFRVLAVP